MIPYTLIECQGSISAIIMCLQKYCDGIFAGKAQLNSCVFVTVEKSQPIFFRATGRRVTLAVSCL